MTTDEAIQEGASTKAPAERRLLYGVLIALVAFAGVMAFGAYGIYSAVKDTAQQGTDLATQVRKACEDPDVNVPPEINCDDADKVIEEAPDAAQGERGEPGPPPSDAQVALAVSLYCANDRCDGENATQAQVSAAVALYCNGRGQCKGPEGEEGAEGEDGQVGAQGPPPSDDQVASAVADYCSTRNDCKGPVGPDGPAGEPGTPGDVVTGGSCEFNGVGSIQITIQTATGPTTFECAGVGITPPPSPGNGGGNGEGQ